MKVYTRTCIEYRREDFVDGITKEPVFVEIKPGQQYTTSRTRKEDETVMVFQAYWVRFPVRLFEPILEDTEPEKPGVLSKQSRETAEKFLNALDGIKDTKPARGDTEEDTQLWLGLTKLETITVGDMRNILQAALRSS